MANPEDLGRFRLKRLLGRGTLGEVWEAADFEQPGVKVVVKIMHAAEEELAIARSHFARDARLVSLLRHPHVVIVYDAGEAAGTSFMVMEKVDGRSLRAALADRATTLEDKLRWLTEIGSGLAAMHEAGLAHRDLKPENVIVRSDGTACLVDLGIAKWTKFDLGVVRGMDAIGDMDAIEEIEAMPDSVPKGGTTYVPPETLERSLYDELGDQYAWGVLAYEALTGDVPTEDSEPLAKRVALRAEVAEAIDRARARLREDRHVAMDHLVRRLTLDPAELRTRSSFFASRRPRPSQKPTEPPPPEPGAGPEPDAAAPTASGGRPEATVVSPAMVGIALAFIAFITAILMDLRPGP